MMVMASFPAAGAWMMPRFSWLATLTAAWVRSRPPATWALFHRFEGHVVRFNLEHMNQLELLRCAPKRPTTGHEEHYGDRSGPSLFRQFKSFRHVN